MYTAAERIQQLRDEGWKVKVRMERVVEDFSDHQWRWNGGDPPKLASRGDGADGKEFRPKGGRTIVILEPPTGDPVEGDTWCHTKLDNFNKKIALEIAFGRAWKQYESREAVPS